MLMQGDILEPEILGSKRCLRGRGCDMICLSWVKYEMSVANFSVKTFQKWICEISALNEAVLQWIKL